MVLLLFSVGQHEARDAYNKEHTLTPPGTILIPGSGREDVQTFSVLLACFLSLVLDLSESFNGGNSSKDARRSSAS